METIRTPQRVKDSRAHARPDRAVVGLAKLDETKRRLLIAAESLFAERPIESISSREIAAKAGNGNNNAVQYHFGGKDGLIQSIFAWRVEQMEAPRAAAYAAIRAQGREPDLVELVEILCLPLLDLVDADGRHSYAAFVSQYILRHRPLGLMHAADVTEPPSQVLRSLLADIHKACGLSPIGGGDYRTGLAQMIFSNMLVLSDNERLQERDPAAFAERVQSTLAMATSALACQKAS